VNSYAGALGSPKAKVPAKKGKTGQKVPQPKIMFGVTRLPKDQKPGKSSVCSDEKNMVAPTSSVSS